MPTNDKSLQELFAEANQLGKQRYHKLTSHDFEEYRRFDLWRYVNGDGECGTTEESRAWVKENSDWSCPICSIPFKENGGRTIDHKLPRARYPWLSMDFRNLWVICQPCNREKGEKHWYEYEHHIFTRYPDRYRAVQLYRPRDLLNNLTAT